MDQLVAMRSFVRVAQALSFQEAARLEDLSQGAISKRVAGLEDHLGVQLLWRNQREVTLTSAGEVYLDQCLRLLEEFDAVEASVRAEAGAPAGIVRITLSPVLSRLIVAPLLVDFLREYPKIEVVSFLTESHSDIIGEGIDVAFRARELEDSSLIAVRISSNPLTLAAAPSYLKAAGVPNQPEDLEAHNCLTFNRMKAPHSWRFTQGRKVREVPIRSTLTADQGDTLVEYAVAGAGLVLMPEWVMANHLSQGRLVRLLPDWTPPNIPLHIVHANSAVVPLRARLLVDYTRREIRQRDLLPR